MQKTFTLKICAILCGIFIFSVLKTFSCDQTSINVLTAVNNGNGTYTYTVNICLGINPNWGGTDGITIDANATIINSGFTPSITTNYSICSKNLIWNGQGCTTGSMNQAPAGGVISNITATASGSISGGNLVYNGTNDLSPPDIGANAGSCGDCGNPDQLCFNVSFITTGPMTQVQLVGAEQDANDCGAGTCCPDEIDNTVPVPVAGCTPPTASFTSNAPECVGSAFNFSNTGTMTGVNISWSFPSGSPSTSTSATPSVTWATAGSYTVVETVCLTAQPTCCSNYSQTIEVNAPPTLTGSGTATTCGLCNGSTNLSVSGGDAPYDYLWPGSLTTQNISALCDGSYTVTVTDNAGCIATRSFTVAASTGPTCAIAATGSPCLTGNSFNFDYTGTTNCTMGNSPTLSWSFPGGTPASGSSDPVNGVTYTTSGTKTATLTVTECTPTLCTVTCSTTVTVNPSPTVSFTPTNPTCAGVCNGSAIAAGAGGTSPYTYAWSGGGTSATKTGLCAGTAYTVTVTDVSGCTVIGSVTLTAGITVTSTFTNSPNQCLTGNSFSFTNTGTSGGTATYSWTFPSGTPASSTTNSPIGVTWSTDGTYTITHTVIQSGCTSTTTGSITVFPQPSATIAPTNPNCNTGCSGQVVATGSGGTPGYSYLWSGGGTSATKTGLCAGTYTLTISDANTCTGIVSATLTAPPVLDVTATPVNATCNGICNGSLSASGSGGTTSYTYNWGGLGSGATKSGVCAGTYTVTITDSKGCTDTASATVTQPALIVPVPAATNATCNGTCNGTVSVSATGGATPYSFLWSGSLGMGSPVSSVCDGTYTVTVTDNAGCTVTASATVNEPPALTVSPTSTNASCNGICDGTVSASGSGGVSPYSYLWNGGLGMGSPVSGVCDGIYTVTVTDASSCTVTGTATVTEPAILTITATPTPATCNGTCNGGLTATASGGTSAYTFTWSGGLGTGATKSSVCDGTYDVTVTDSKGCTAITSATVTEPTILVASASGNNPLCNSVCNGTLSASGSGGISPYSFLWSGGLGMGSPISSVCDGVYTVTVTDANSCTNTANVTLTDPPAITATATPTPATCNGTCNGSISSSGSGGTTPYSYNWSGGLGMGSPVTAVCDGPYTVTVTDFNNCSTTVNVTVTEPSALSLTVTAGPATCNGTCNGTLLATGSGGTSPYTYSWDGGLGSGASKTGVCDGLYNVTITDSKGCIQVASGTVTEPASLSVSTTPSPVTCNGVCNGSIIATGAGGTTGYTYTWSGGLGMGSPVSSVCDGSYSVTITDANGCTATNTALVTEPSAISLTATSTSATCGNSNGTGTVVASGGTSPYTYLWCNSQTSSTATGLVAGGCNVTVTDASGCTSTSVATVNSVGGAVVTIPTFSNVSCSGGNNGSATASVTGGTTPYSYSWAPSGGSTATASNLTAGTYTINVTDNNSCIASATIDITQPTPLLSSISATANVSCNALCDGSATVSASGGTTAYSYLWQGGGTSATKTGLCAGSYVVTVTDNKGCSTTSTATITQPVLLTATTVASPATCNGTCNGSINLTPSGGTTSYSYSWDNAALTEDLTALCAGSYSVTVTDAAGCVATTSATISQPVALSLSTSTTNSTCGTANGTATVTASGGTTGYTYLWQNAQSSALATGLAAGTYSVTVTDANGCIASTTATVTDASAPLISVSSTTNVSCFGGNNGSASTTVTGGSSPFTYLWAPSGGTGANATGLTATGYSVTVTDNNGCTAIAATTITQPGILGGVISSSANVSCNGDCDGTATVTASGGTSPYSYFWQVVGGTNSTKTGLCAGNFNVVISDANGCASTATATITEPTALSSSIIGSNTTCNGACNGAANLTALGGTAPYSYTWSNSSTSEDLSGICAGSFDATVTDNKGCTSTSTVTITQPVAIATSTSSVNSTCGSSNGQACVSASGGTTPFSYSWNTSPVQTTACATGVPAGNYAVTVTDANGCTASTSVIVSNSSGGVASATVVSNTTGSGICDGTASASMSGGSSPYTYLWDNGQITSSSTGLCAGSVCVTVTDANVCPSVACIIITEPGPIVLTTIAINVTCNALCNGSIDLSVSGGVSPYTYQWTGGATAQDPGNLCIGTYTVTVTDNNGITATTSASITQPAAIFVSGVITSLTCNAVCSGAINITASGGTSPYTYSWSNLSPFEDVSSLCAGSYTVTVTDANLCTTSSTFTVLQPTAISLSFSSVNASCGGSNGSASVSVSGGTSPYSYNWSAGSTGSTQTGVAAGSFDVTVTDALNCVSTGTVSVSNNTTGTASASVLNNVLCNGGSSGQASASITGGSSPFTYTWSNGDKAVIADSLSAGTYTVSIQDADTCIVTATVVITQPTAIDASAGGAPASCNGLCDGALNAVASGGTSPYSFNWSGGLGSGSNISGVCAGPFTVTAVDANGCTASAAYTINQPTPISLLTSDNSSTCFQSDGQVSVTATGGTTAYTYLWNNPGNSTSATVSGVPAGTYSVTVTDAALCTATSSATVSDNAAPVVSASVLSSISCNGVCDGTATLSVSGGTSPYFYLWSNGDSGTSADSLCQGSGSVSVTDATGCTGSATVNLSQPVILSLIISGIDVTCNGGSNGSASAAASGGTSPYSFLWASGEGTQNISSLFAGTYMATVTDNNGCSASSSVTINQPSLLIANASSVPVLCYGSCNGSLSVSGSGGISPYNFLWSDGLGTNASVSNVCNGFFTVTLSDANNCTATDTVTVGQPAMLNSFASSLPVSCFGQCNGSVTDSATGGTLPYAFTWSGGLGSGANQNNVCAGSYNVTVTDGNGCTSVQTTSVSGPAVLSVTLSSANVSCNGNCDGTAQVTVSGGNSPYSYLWNNSGFDTGASVDSLCSGSYSVSVTDAQGCDTSGSVTIIQPSPLVLGNSTSGSTCQQSDGSAIVTILSGGVTPYSYQWAATAGNQTTATATGLAAGCYNVTVTNGNGCIATDNICVSDLGAPTVNLLTQTNVSCFNSCDGFAQIAVAGGNPPYTYTWFDSAMNSIGQSTASAFNLCAGTFIGSMVDSTGCTGSISVIISQPSMLSGIISSSDSVSCFGNCDGQATAAGSGGNSPFSYQWNDLMTQSSPNATGLCPGTYNVVITDFNSCDTTISVIIGEPVPVSLVTNTNNSYCATPSGQACVSVSDGVSPFTYLWNDSQSTQCAESLIPGSYLVTVTDFNGCTAGATATVGNTAAGTASISNLINVACNGVCTGSASVSMSGSGTSPFTYLWSNGSTSVSATGLCAGNISVTVTDSNNCSSITTAIITEPGMLTNSVSVSPAVCFGDCNGNATSTSSGGTSPYAYLWSDGLAQITPTASGLCAGNYSVTVTDSKGCSLINNDIVSEPSELLLIPTVFNAHCGQPDGNACVTVSGGSSPYSYLWASGEINQCLNNVISGTYNLTVTDANGCTAPLGVAIQDLDGPIVSVISVTNTKCKGSCEGSAQIDMSGGAGSYIVQWFDAVGNSIFQTNPLASNLCAGNYSSTVTDTSGCSASVSVTITEPTDITFNQSTFDPTCNGDCSGSASAIVSGGTSPYTYLWNDPLNQSTATATGLCAGGYVLTIVDNNNCTVFGNFTLGNPTSMTATTGITNTTCSGVCDGTATVTPFNGDSPFSYQWDAATGNQTNPQAIDLCSDTFSVTVTDANGCITIASAIVGQPASLSAAIIDSGNVSCYGGNNGYAQASVAGGTPGYIYNWSDGQINQIASNLIAGIYTVTVMDIKGCTETVQIIITQPGPLGTGMTPTPVSCYGNCDGGATLSVSGGVLPYSYLWSASTGFQTSPTATGLCGGSHSVTITDNKGCTKTSSVVIIEPTEIAIVGATIANTNCGQNNGQICVNVSGGTVPYSYQWNDPITQTASCANNLYTGCYTVNITDGSGCSFDTVLCIQDLAGPAITLVNSDSVTCNGMANGLVEFSVSGGAGSYSYLWFSGVGDTLSFTSAIAYPLPGGNYTLQVSDAAGCKTSLSEYVFEPNAMVGAITSTVDNACYNQCQGQATVTVGGGTSPYSYTWSPGGQMTSIATGLCANTYTVVVKDANGCTVTSTDSITQPPPIIINDSVINVSCNGGIDGSISLNVTGGTPPSFFVWSPNSGSNSSAYNLTAGIYNTTVTDLNSCFATTVNTITEPVALSSTFSVTDATCGDYNGTATITVSGGTPAYTYQWQNAQTDSTATSLGAGSYLITITDANGCSLNESTTIANQGGPQSVYVSATAITCKNSVDGTASVDSVIGGTSPYTYLWVNGTTSPTINDLDSGNYVVTVTDANGCKFQQGVNIFEPDSMKAIGVKDTTICFGQSTQIWISGSGGTGQWDGYAYSWQPATLSGAGPNTVNPTSTTSYYFTVFDNKGCMAQGSITVSVKEALSLSMQGGVDTVDICQKLDTADLFANAYGGNDSVYTYTWYNLGITDSNVVSTTQSLSPLSSTPYVVIASDGCSLSDTDTVVVMVRPIPIATFATNPDKGCPPLLANFNTGNPGTDIAKPTFSWDFNGDGIFGDDTARLPQNVPYTDPGSYTVSLIVTSEFKCPSDTFVMNNYITVYPVPEAGATHSPANNLLSLVNSDVQFSDTSAGSPSYWTWDFGDGDTSSAQHPAHTYKDTGTYYILLIVENQKGCRDTIQDTVIIKNEFAIYVPNAFTPNGNEKNEFFAAKGVGVDPNNYVMYIFDRWGDLIWETHDIDKGWDGTANGGSEMVQQDVYVWLIVAYDFLGEKHPLIGHVTVVK